MPHTLTALAPFFPLARGAWNAAFVTVAEPATATRPIVITTPWPALAGVAIAPEPARPALPALAASEAASALTGTAIPEATTSRVTRPGAARTSGLAPTSSFAPTLARSFARSFTRAWCGTVIHARRDSPALERHAVHLLDDGVRVCRGNLRDRVAIADVELADAITRYAGLAGDRANEVTRPCAIPVAHAEKHSREVA
jgi:hypothetical protein